MNIPSIIVLLIIGIAFILAVHSIIKNKIVVVIAVVVIYVIINVIDM